MSCVRYCLHKSRPFVPYLGLSQLTPHPRILCAQLSPFCALFLSPRHSFALSIPECYVLHLRVFSDSLPCLRRLRVTCLNAMAIYGKKRLLWALPFRGSDQNCVPIFFSSHACYTFYPFHPASVYYYNACWVTYVYEMVSLNSSVITVFSIDNAHLMYNAHPKLFRHSFWCIYNSHDVFFDR